MEKLSPLTAFIGIDGEPKKIGRLQIEKAANAQSGFFLQIFTKEKSKFPKYSLQIRRIFTKLDKRDPKKCTLCIYSPDNKFEVSSMQIDQAQLHSYFEFINKNSLINKDNHDDTQIDNAIKEIWPFPLLIYSF